MADNQNEIDKDFLNIFEDKLSLLKHLLKYNHDILLEQIHATHEGKTFFSLINRKTDYTVIKKEMVEFFLENGFDFFKPLIKENTISYEYANVFSQLTDDAALLLSQIIYEKDKDFLFKNNEKFNLLEISIAKSKFKTFDFLLSVGIPLSDKIEAKISQDVEILNKFIEIRDKYHTVDQEVEFRKTISWLESFAPKVVKYDSYNTEKFLNYFDAQLSKYNLAQKEEMVATAVISDCMPLLNNVIKKLVPKITLKTYNPEHCPLWINIGKTKSATIFYAILDTLNTPISASLEPVDHNNVDKTFLKQIKLFLNNQNMLGYTPSKYDSHSSDMVRKKKIYKIILERFTVEFLSSNENLVDKDSNWFDIIISDPNFKNDFLPYLKNMVFKDIATEKLSNFLMNTWFKKDSENNFNFTKIHKYDLSKENNILNAELWNNPDLSHIYTKEVMLIHFNRVLKFALQSNYNFIDDKITLLLEKLSSFESFNLEEINISAEDEKNKEQSLPKFFTKLNEERIKHFQKRLEQNLPSSKENKPKFKL